jgi:Zn-dependent metalloprotease
MHKSPPSPCFIVPPHIVRSIAEHGTARQRGRALATIEVSERIRGARAALARVPPTREACALERARTVYDAGHRERPPYRRVRREHEKPTRDAAVNEAFDGSGSTFDFYLAAYERCSIDAYGLPIDSVVHFGKDYGNAFWDGYQMVYGDGDGDLFNRFTLALEVIGHELTHGVVQSEAALEYWDQAGALNESMADVFGSLVKQRARGQRADEADWLVGAGLFTKNVEGAALRSLKAPGTAYDDDVLGKDPQPAHMRDFVRTDEDNGGVHINSGIPNRAFYLAATAVGGRAWERVGHVWYLALVDELKPTSTFAECARKTAALAARVYGEGSREAKAVTSAWSKVGVQPGR